jgi:hypothetical protein
MMVERKLFNKYWVSYGYGKRLAFGFSIDKYAINIEFLCFWVGVEL